MKPVICFLVSLMIGAALATQAQTKSFFYKKLYAQQPGFYLELDLIRLGSELEGHFVQGGSQKKGELSGFVLKSGAFLLEETVFNPSTGEDQLIATLTLTPESDTEFSVEWLDIQSSDRKYFKLKESYPDGSIPIQLLHEYKHYKARAEIELILAQLQTKHPYTHAGVAPINAYINSHILNYQHPNSRLSNFTDHTAFLDDFLRRYKEMEADHEDTTALPIWENKHKILVVTNKSHIVALEFVEIIYEGGAHPTENIFYVNFDLKTGHVLRLSDVIAEQHLPAFEQLAEQYFRQHYGFREGTSFLEEGINFPEDHFTLNQNFALRNTGISFHYNIGTIAPRAMGDFELFLPYEKIRGYVKPGSPLQGLAEGAN
ncbi:MAG: DUF3298 domain-containing protein [Bernardetiaceae bacterium]